MSEKKTYTSRKSVTSRSTDEISEVPEVKEAPAVVSAGVVQNDVSVEVTKQGLKVTVLVPLATAASIGESTRAIQDASIRANRFARQLGIKAGVNLNAKLDTQYVPSEGTVVLTQKRDITAEQVKALQSAVEKTERPLG